MRTHIVAKGDTLWKLAKFYTTTVDAIGRLNGLKGTQLHRLAIGQVLRIPDLDSAKPDAELKVKFRSMDFKTITPKKVKVEHDGKEEWHVMDQADHLLLSIQDHALGLKVWVENLNKEMEQVLSHDILPIGKWNVFIDSRKVKADGALQPKRGAPSSSATAVKAATTQNAQLKQGQAAEEQTRVEAGKPVHAVATIYTSANLRLPPVNEKYRELIIAAAEAHQLSPQSLAAMINIEAAKARKGPNKGEWLEQSNGHDATLAQGLAQFFPAGWTDVSKDTSSLLHKECGKLGNGALMAKRRVARYAIDGAATYAQINLRNFAKQSRYPVDSLPPEDKAKVAYILHHDGLTGTMMLVGLEEPMSWTRARKKLIGQLGKDVEKADRIIAQYDKNAFNAYRGWLFSYCDAGLDVNSYIVKDAAQFAKPARSIADIFAFLASQPPVPRPTPRKGAAKAKPASVAVAKPATAAPTPPAAAAPKPPVAAAPAAPAAPATPAAAAAPAAGAMPAPQWHDPLDVCTIRSAGLASVNGAKFGMVRNGGTKAHQGIDLIAVPGTRIYAVADGRAISVPQKPGNAYGHTLVLKVGIDDLPDIQRTKVLASMPNATYVYFYYAHLNEMIDGDESRNVNAGDIIGKTGNSGNATNMVTVATGAHLHFEVRKVPAIPKTPGQPLINRVNPLPYIVNCTNA